MCLGEECRRTLRRNSIAPPIKGDAVASIGEREDEGLDDTVNGQGRGQMGGETTHPEIATPTSKPASMR